MRLFLIIVFLTIYIFLSPFIFYGIIRVVNIFMNKENKIIASRCNYGDSFSKIQGTILSFGNYTPSYELSYKLGNAEFRCFVNGVWKDNLSVGDKQIAFLDLYQLNDCYTCEIKPDDMDLSIFDGIISVSIDVSCFLVNIFLMIILLGLYFVFGANIIEFLRRNVISEYDLYNLYITPTNYELVPSIELHVNEEKV